MIERCKGTGFEFKASSPDRRPEIEVSDGEKEPYTITVSGKHASLEMTLHEAGILAGKLHAALFQLENEAKNP